MSTAKLDGTSNPTRTYSPATWGTRPLSSAFSIFLATQTNWSTSGRTSSRHFTSQSKRLMTSFTECPQEAETSSIFISWLACCLRLRTTRSTAIDAKIWREMLHGRLVLLRRDWLLLLRAQCILLVQAWPVLARLLHGRIRCGWIFVFALQLDQSFSFG